MLPEIREWVIEAPPGIVRVRPQLVNSTLAVVEGVQDASKRELMNIHSPALMSTEDSISCQGHAGDVWSSPRKRQLQRLIARLSIVGMAMQNTGIDFPCCSTQRLC